jgi:hypothetical protein
MIKPDRRCHVDESLRTWKVLEYCTWQPRFGTCILQVERIMMGTPTGIAQAHGILNCNCKFAC